MKEETEINDIGQAETTEEFNKFLQKRVVKVEIEALREELKKEVESLPVPEDSFEIDDEEAIVNEIEQELGQAEDPEEDVTTEEFNKFLTKRAEAVK